MPDQYVYHLKFDKPSFIVDYFEAGSLALDGFIGFCIVSKKGVWTMAGCAFGGDYK